MADRPEDLTFGKAPAEDGNLLFGPDVESIDLIGYFQSPIFNAEIGPQQKLVRLLFEQSAPASTNLVFGAGDAPPSSAISVTLTGLLEGPTLLAQARAITHANFAGSLPKPAFQAFVAATVDAALTGALPAPTFEASVVGYTEAVLTGALPAPTLTASVRSPALAYLTGTLPGPQMLAEATYSSNTARPTVGQSLTAWQPTSATEIGGVTQGQQIPLKQPVGWAPPWQQADKIQPGVDHPLPKVFQPEPVVEVARHQQAERLRDSSEFRHQEAARSVRKLLAEAFEQAALLRDSTGFRHQVGDMTKRASRDAYWQEALGLRKPWHSDFQPAKPWLYGMDGRFQEAVPPPPGVTAPPPPPGPPVCYEAGPDLVFVLPATASASLLFRCDYDLIDPTPGEQVVVPIQRVYIVLNNVALKRTSDNAVVPALNLTLSLDVSSWTWGFQASLPATAQALVEPTSNGPVVLSAWVNGTEFRVLAEQISRERVFGQATIRVAGRGINAELDAPYAPVMTFSNASARTSQQLLDDVLTVNGVPIGYDITYGQEAWNVPAGVFGHQGTYIGALVAIAQAGGGYLLPHPSLRAFSVKALYPQAPWEWGTVTPNFVLPAAVVTREGVQWKEQPAYNRVFVSGEAQGVLGQVTRAGTAGDVLAPMVVDPLITTAAAARQRGLSILGNTGRQLHHSLSLPVLPATGVIQPGAYVQYNDGEATRIGLVRSTEVSVGLPDVIQTIGVECHA